ncbi:MAG: TldD/PmbA family protein [Elusimicrobia bacterium]|nr:TldD/PmbA family protein [Elusimicrobiota bacterium]
MTPAESDRRSFWDILWRYLPKGACYGDIHWQESRSLVVRLESGAIEQAAQTQDREAAWRCLKTPKGPTLLFSASDAHPKTLAALIDRELFRASRKKQLSRPLPDLQWFRHEAADSVAGQTLDGKVRFLLDLDRRMRVLGGPNLRQVTAHYAEAQTTVVQWTSEGTLIGEEKMLVNLSLYVLAESGRMRQGAYESIGGAGGWELIERADLGALADMVVRRALGKLEASPAPAGEFPIVIASSAGGTFLHEAVGHALEADAVLDGASPYFAGRLGRRVAAAGVTIVDDPTLPGARGSYRFDDEGVAARPTILVEDGILKDFLFDRAGGFRAGRASNGHGRREAPGNRPLPRMSNLFLKPGADNPEQIIGAVADGMLVTRMGGGEVDTATGQFMFEVEEGWRIKNGRLAGMIRDANLLGGGPEALRRISRIGRDLGWAVGTCGKGGQRVPVSDGLPTILIDKLLVGGNAK